MRQLQLPLTTSVECETAEHDLGQRYPVKISDLRDPLAPKDLCGKTKKVLNLEEQDTPHHFLQGEVIKRQNRLRSLTKSC